MRNLPWLGLVLLVASSAASRDIRGSLVLAGDQAMTIENEHVRVHGTISLSGNAKLIIRGATVEIVQSYHEQYPVKLEGQAQLIVEDAHLDSDYNFSIELWGRSSLLMTRTNAPQAVVTLINSVFNEISDSTIRMFSAEPTVFPFTPQTGLARARVRSSRIRDVGLGVAGTAEVTVRGLKAGDR